MRMAVWLALSVLTLAALLLQASCREDDATCYEGDYAACSCAGGALGYQSCITAEDRYGACVCDGTTPGLDGSFEAAPEAEAAPREKLPFMSRCTTSEQCESGLCHTFSQQGSFCTTSCKDTSDCPAPSSGCNNRGLCKAP